MAKFFFQQNIYLNMDVSKGLMEMQGKDAKEGSAFGDAFRNSRFLQRLREEIKEKARMTTVALIFVGTILAIELAVWGIVSLACGK